MKFFSKWVDKKSERVFAVLGLAMLPIGVISIIGIQLSEVIQMTDRVTEMLKCTCFLSLGLMCLLFAIVYIIHLARRDNRAEVMRDIRVMLTRGYTWSMLFLLLFLVIAYLASLETSSVELTIIAGRIVALLTMGSAVIGFIQNRREKMAYKNAKSIKNILILLAVAVLFLIVGIYLCIHFPA